MTTYSYRELPLVPNWHLQKNWILCYLAQQNFLYQSSGEGFTLGSANSYIPTRVIFGLFILFRLLGSPYGAVQICKIRVIWKWVVKQLRHHKFCKICPFLLILDTEKYCPYILQEKKRISLPSLERKLQGFEIIQHILLIKQFVYLSFFSCRGDNLGKTNQIKSRLTWIFQNCE